MLHRQEVQVEDVRFQSLDEVDRVDEEDGDRRQGLGHHLHACARDAEGDARDQEKETAFRPADQEDRQDRRQEAELRVQGIEPHVDQALDFNQ